jgi:hypothetical protein
MNRSFWRNLLFLIPFVPLLMAGSCSSLNLELAQKTLSIQKEGVAQTVTVDIIRERVDGVVQLTASGVPAGVNVSFSPASTTGNTSTMSVTATNAAAVGSSNISVTGTAPGFVTPLKELALTVTASSTPAIPTITSFTATPSSLPVGGGDVTLSWAVTGATTLSIDQSVGTVTGTSKVVNVTANKNFTLTATNATGSVTSSTTVTVAATPPPPTAGKFDEGKFDEAIFGP